MPYCCVLLSTLISFQTIVWLLVSSPLTPHGSALEKVEVFRGFFFALYFHVSFFFVCSEACRLFMVESFVSSVELS